MKHTTFIADLHLEENLPKITELFIQFLENYTPNADALYILGDLFKFWAGDDDRAPLHEQIKNLLKKLSQSGIKIYLMPGNRDFLLSTTFAKESGCVLLSDPCKIDLYGIPTVLTHGDILCSKDYLMRIFRSITRHKSFIKLFLKLPLKFRKSLANQTHQYSNKLKFKKSKIKINPTNEAISKIMQTFAAQLLIHGHTHKIGIHDIFLNNKILKRFVLGAWNERTGVATGSFLNIYEDNKKQLMQFKSNQLIPSIF